MSYKKTTEEFILLANLRHGNRYDYSKSIYTGSKNKITIICSKEGHGEFFQIPGNHTKFKPTGCPKCNNIASLDRKRKPVDKFIAEAISVHGEKYDYSNITHNAKKYIIICKEHGEFLQNSTHHIKRRQGCPACGIIKIGDKSRKSVDKFIAEAISVHGNKYIYDEVVYINTDINVIIKCPIHGIFHQKPSSHIGVQKQGCPDCGIIKCALSNTLTTEEFILKSQMVHGDLYDYSLTQYINTKERVIIICKEHGRFTQISNHHLSGNGCMLCKNKTEGKLKKWLEDNEFNIEYQKKFDWCVNNKGTSLPYDFYIPKLNIIIELDGEQHFFQVSKWKSPIETQERDEFKMNCANANNISVIRIYQLDVWNDTNDWEFNLLDAINEYTKVKNIFIGNVYDSHYDVHPIIPPNIILSQEYINS